MSALSDLLLARLSGQVEDLAVRAVAGGNLLRELAWLRWCPACRDDQHWNHREGVPRRGPTPAPGACWTLGNGEPCACTWRA